MTILVGPILSFRGSNDGQWALSCVVVTDGEAPDFAVDGLGDHDIGRAALWTTKRGTVHRFCFSVPLEPNPSVFRYYVEGASFDVALPGHATPRMAYASCNGFSHAKYMKRVGNKYRLWEAMREKHEEDPYHLLLLGGDQVYADPIWESVSSIRKWNNLSFKDGNSRPFTATMKAQVERFYFDLYVESWKPKPIADMLAAVPTIAMWDDHDIFDGWGSYPEERQNCDVFRGIARVATGAFRVFQQHVSYNDLTERRAGSIAHDGVFTFGYEAGHIAVLALDMRSERSPDRVISQEHWNAIYRWVDKLEKLDHLVVMSSIPVVYPGFDTLEMLLGAVPGHQDLEDDLRDHWNSEPHKDERLRLVHRLFDTARSSGIRPTLISGDVHVGAVGVLESSRNPHKRPVVINQLISSAIVHPPPNAVVIFCLKHLFDSADEVDRGIVARMTEFPGNKVKFIGQRNFLSLEPDDKRRIWANWIVEGNSYPTTKVIHALEAT